jgi:hypothetical protein
MSIQIPKQLILSFDEQYRIYWENHWGWVETSEYFNDWLMEHIVALPDWEPLCGI